MRGEGCILMHSSSSCENTLSGSLVTRRNHSMESSEDGTSLRRSNRQRSCAAKKTVSSSPRQVTDDGSVYGTMNSSVPRKEENNSPSPPSSCSPSASPPSSQPPPMQVSKNLPEASGMKGGNKRSYDSDGSVEESVVQEEEEEEDESLEDDSMSDTSTRSSSTSPQHEQDEDDDSSSSSEPADDLLIALRNKKILLSRLSEAAIRGKLSLINFSRRGLGPNDADLLKRVIINNPHLSVLKLGYNNLGDLGAVTISSALLQGESHHHLSVLDLCFNCIGDKGCESLSVNAIAGNFNLRTLFLSGNNIEEKGAISIAGAILHGSCLKCLHLSANKIGAVGVKAIVTAIAESEARMVVAAPLNNQSGCRIEQVDFGSTMMTSVGFVALPNMMIANTSLRVLSVTNNGIDDRDLAVFAQAVSQNDKMPIEKLHFSFNEISCVGVECLMNAVWGSKTLREIKLDNNKVQDRGAQLCAVVLTSINLESLDLSFNRVTTVGIRALMKSLSENTSLLSLAVCGIPIDQNASKAVSYALAYNSTLRSFYMDNCSVGYSAQRHVVAGIVSNRSESLRVLTGFPLGPITVTLGMPQLPESWSNDQVLGFVRLMWRQWREKQGIGDPNLVTQEAKGPAPPAAVAAAAKLALASLGDSPSEALHTEPYEKELSETSPLVSPNAALLEKTASGNNLRVPVLSDTRSGGDSGTMEAWSESFQRNKSLQPILHSPANATSALPLGNPERRNQNLRWLRVNYRSLIDIGQLPFNNADLWQLHQYYFSPPYFSAAESESNTMSPTFPNGENSGQSETSTSTEIEGSEAVRSQAHQHQEQQMLQRDPAESRAGRSPPPTPDIYDASKAPVLGRTISCQTLSTAVAAAVSSSHKRRSETEYKENNEPAAKRAKKLKPRIAYYPRIRARLESLGAKPLEQTLSLLRKLKYVESEMFPENNAYDEYSGGHDPHKPTRSDVEMILLDLI